jgi:hypothetical protein
MMRIIFMILRFVDKLKAGVGAVVSSELLLKSYKSKKSTFYSAALSKEATSISNSPRLSIHLALIFKLPFPCTSKTGQASHRVSQQYGSRG